MGNIIQVVGSIVLPFLYRTVREGTQALVLNHLGEGQLVVGPQRIFLFRKRLRQLVHYQAGPDQYLKIQWTDGRKEHRQGPCEMFRNPIEVTSVILCDAEKLNANEVLVVYKPENGKDGNSVERRVVRGPAVFMPTAVEWFHKFRWHGADVRKSNTEMIPKFRVFYKLPTIPEHFHYNAREVRTCDDTEIMVKLMIFYELEDIEKMLNMTHDPIGDFINALCADIVSFAAKLSYEEFQQQAGKLNLQNTYPQLVQSAARIGYNISKVVYRGYHAGDHLQAMQDDAIKIRTELKLNKEVQEMEQKIMDHSLKKEQMRSSKKKEMEKRISEHKQKVETMKKETGIKRSEVKHREKLKIQEMKKMAKLELEAAEKTHKIEVLGKLRDLGVDLTKYLVNRNWHSIDEEIQVVDRDGTRRYTDEDVCIDNDAFMT